MDQTGWALVWVVFVFIVDVAVRILAIIFVPRNRRPTAAMAWLLAIYFIPIVGVLLFLLIELVERWMMPWHASQRHDTQATS